MDMKVSSQGNNPHPFPTNPLLIFYEGSIIGDDLIDYASNWDGILDFDHYAVWNMLTRIKLKDGVYVPPWWEKEPLVFVDNFIEHYSCVSRQDRVKWSLEEVGKVTLEILFGMWEEWFWEEGRTGSLD